MIGRCAICDACGRHVPVGKVVAPDAWTTLRQGGKLQAFCSRACATTGMNSGTVSRAYPCNLSAIEVRMLKLLSRGYANKEIGHDVGLTDRTVRNRFTHVFQKLRAPDRLQAVLIAHALGVIDLNASSQRLLHQRVA